MLKTEEFVIGWVDPPEAEEVFTIRTNGKIEKILGVGVVGKTICVWCTVDTEKAPENVRILTIGTGHSFKAYEDRFNLSGKYEYIDSYLIYNDSFVGHVFRVIE